MWPLSGREIVEACGLRDAPAAFLGATFGGVAYAAPASTPTSGSAPPKPKP
jgi:hypothetical protein